MGHHYVAPFLNCVKGGAVPYIACGRFVGAGVGCAVGVIAEEGWESVRVPLGGVGSPSSGWYSGMGSPSTFGTRYGTAMGTLKVDSECSRGFPGLSVSTMIGTATGGEEGTTLGLLAGTAGVVVDVTNELHLDE
jgi:hypothetical protein